MTLLLLLVSCSLDYSIHGCVRDGDCESGEICGASGACMAAYDRCDQVPTCAYGYSCQGGRCVATNCAADGTCPAGTLCTAGQCIPGRCSDDAACGTGRICDTPTGLCIATPCASDEGCPDGTRCDSRFGDCRPPSCAGHADCDLDERCDAVASTCFTAITCIDDTVCPSDQVCNIGGGYCMAGDRDDPAYQQPYGAERCDGADNDRDGEVDEPFLADLGASCSAGDATCAASGFLVCAADGNGVMCDATPRDPEAERCDYVDNDCDGLEDEDFAGLGTSCTVGEGICASAGTLGCASDGASAICDAVAGTPVSETCNSLDDDCDGQTDEDFPEVGTSCAAGIGACRGTGTISCDGGGGVACSAVAGTPGTESCNGVDDDCDGELDEDLFRSCSSACGNGTEWCVAGSWTGCTATTPSTEVCNAVDDDCDGETDEGCDDSWQGGATP